MSAAPNRWPRPAIHYAPPANWMNDPNGLIWLDGTCHLYHQHNPEGTAWGHMSWGHATSDDLLRWTPHPVAIPEQPDKGYMIFSGTCVLDDRNASGLGTDDQPALIACYTAHHPATENRPVRQNIHLAVSHDGGATFQPFDGNPVLDVGQAKFGDPKVFRHEPTDRWVMVNILGRGQGRIVLYSSPDMIHWDYLSDFHAPGDPAGMWECPDLLALAVDGDPGRTRWVMKTNFQDLDRQAYASRYWIGTFDGRSFQPDSIAQINADSDDYYAELTCNRLPANWIGRALQFGWLRQPAQPDRPWTGMMSLPRALSLTDTPDGPQLRNRPIPAVESLRGQPTHCTSAEAMASAAGQALAAGAAELELHFAAGADSGVLLVDLAGGQTGRLSLLGEPGELRLQLPGRYPMSVPLPQRRACAQSLRVFLDAAAIEIFAADGACHLSAVLDPAGQAETLRVETGDQRAELAEATVWPLSP